MELRYIRVKNLASANAQLFYCNVFLLMLMLILILLLLLQGCRNFYNNGTCNNECPRDTIYNRTTYKYEKNPNAKVAFGKLCLDKCPGTYSQYS